jgi:hypothetical protein
MAARVATGVDRRLFCLAFATCFSDGMCWTACGGAVLGCVEGRVLSAWQPATAAQSAEAQCMPGAQMRACMDSPHAVL